MTVVARLGARCVARWAPLRTLCTSAAFLRPASTSVPRSKRVLALDTNSDLSIHPSFVTRQQPTQYQGQPVRPVVSVTVAEYYDLDSVIAHVTELGLTPKEIVPGECVMFKQKDETFFVFKFGTVVAWDVAETVVVNEWTARLAACAVNKYPLESEDLDYVQLKDNPQESHIDPKEEIVCLSGPNIVLDQLAFSYGISRSTRLAVLERAVEKHTALTRETTLALAEGKKIALKGETVTKLSGRLLLLRGKLNLYSELVETPDIYWAEPRLEQIHNAISQSLDVPLRISVLNRKLDYLADEAHALVEILTHKTETNLELIIIYLIVMEVCFELYHFYDKLGGTYNLGYFYKLIHGVERGV